MESYIEHNLTTLISSVPKVYSRNWLEKLVRYIVQDKNGEDMQLFYLKPMTMNQQNGVVDFSRLIP